MVFKKRKKLNKIVENDEPLARYIFYKNHFSKEKKRVKRQAFMPYKNIRIPYGKKQISGYDEKTNQSPRQTF